MFSQFCPRCDREFQSDASEAALEAVKAHVEKAHPEYDPEWWVESGQDDPAPRLY